MKKVLVFGSFDILHPGHHNFFEQAKQYGDRLYVIVARNSTIEKVKQRKPVHDELKRKHDIEKTGLAHSVLLGHPSDPYALIVKIKPDVICLGYDQTSFTSDLEKELKKRNLSPKIIRLNPYKPHIYKSSKLRKQDQI
jgi:FAD synthetase